MAEGQKCTLAKDVDLQGPDAEVTCVRHEKVPDLVELDNIAELLFCSILLL